MFTTTASLAASASASTSPSRESRCSGCSFASGMICAGTRSAVRSAGGTRRSPAPSAGAPAAPPPRASRSRAARRSRGSSPTTPRARPSRNAASSSRRMSLLGQRLDELDQLLLALARHAGGDVDEAVRVRADQVHRPVAQPLLGQPRRAPASTSAASCARSRPACRPASARAGSSAARRSAAGARRSARPRRRAAASSRRASRPAPARTPPTTAPPRAASPPRAGARAACSTRSGRRPASGSGRRRRTRSPAAPRAFPRPLSCQRRRRAGASASSHSSMWHAVAGEHLGLLAHDHQVAPRDPVGQPPDRVDERAQVGLVAAGERMQARSHRAVRRLEHPQRRLAARAQQRVVCALVELDLVAQPPAAGSSERLASAIRETTTATP